MQYISTKELAGKWQISISRVVRLAKAGRIPDAKLIGKSWVFPAEAVKPADNRRKKNRPAAQATAFRFPLYLYSDYSKEEIDTAFTAEERILYEGELLFFRGEYRKCADMLTALLSSAADRYVCFGAFYHLCLASVYLCRYGAALSFYSDIQALYLDEATHKREMEFLIRDLESNFVGNNYYLEDFSIDMSAPYPLHMREYLLLECAFSDMLRAQYKAVPLSPQPYEILLEADRARFSPLAALTLHLYTAVLCRSYGQSERSIRHICESCRIARENDMEYSSVAYMSKYLMNIYESALIKEAPAQLNRLKAISDDMFEAFHRLFDFAGKNSLLHILNASDSILISFAVKQMTNKEIASALHLSVNTISKRYSLLLEKTGTHSKKELADWYIQTIKGYYAPPGTDTLDQYTEKARRPSDPRA